MFSIDTKVRIFPDNEFKIIGIVKEIHSNGVVFEIVSSQKPRTYPEGKNVFIAYSAQLIVVEV